MNFFAFSAPGYCGPGASSELNILIELEQKYCKFNFFPRQQKELRCSYINLGMGVLH